MSPIDGGLLVLRIVVGLTIIAHGVNHARTLEGTARWFAKVGFRAAPAAGPDVGRHRTGRRRSYWSPAFSPRWPPPQSSPP